MSMWGRTISTSTFTYIFKKHALYEQCLQFNWLEADLE